MKDFNYNTFNYNTNIGFMSNTSNVRIEFNGPQNTNYTVKQL